MIGKTAGGVHRQLGALFEGGSLGGWGDAALLERFAAARDALSEAAFATLVERHGPMVLRVCRARLGDEHDAHDAFQAVFLVLARKARKVRVRDTLAPWLHGVAWRAASRASAAAARRRRHERRAAELAPVTVEETMPRDDTEALLHEEVRRLPAVFRQAVILCHLEGLTIDQAAERLGAPVGTVRSRLSRARDQLRGRLLRRGIAPAAVAAVLAAKSASACVVPQALAGPTVTLAVAAYHTGIIPARLAWLVKQAPYVAGVKSVVSTGLVVGLIAGASGLAGRAAGERPAAQAEAVANEPAQAAVPVPSRVVSDRDRLQGNWRVVTAVAGGRPTAVPSAPMTFDGDTVEFGPFGYPQTRNRYRFEVDPEGDSPALHVVRDGHPPRWWLYELHGDTLRTAAWFSLNDTRRPRGFDDGGPGRRLMVLELVREPERSATSGP